MSTDEKKVFTRQQEVFAAFAEITDHEIGRVVQAIDDLGVIDNTLIIYITGDNGSSANGGPLGKFNTFYSFNQIPETLEDQLKHLNEFGGPISEMTLLSAGRSPTMRRSLMRRVTLPTAGPPTAWSSIGRKGSRRKAKFAHNVITVSTSLQQCYRRPGCPNRRSSMAPSRSRSRV